MSDPWAAEVEVTPELARRLIEAQCADLRPTRVSSFGVGWDNTAFLVETAATSPFVFRFPRRQIAVPGLELEGRMLPLLAPRLPVPVPEPTHFGAPGPDYRWPFLGYRFLPGSTACKLRLGDDARARTAEPLGRFLRALHSIPEIEARRMGAPEDRFGKVDPQRRIPDTRERLVTLERAGVPVPAAAIDLVEAFSRLPMPPPARALCHGDLYARHLLIDGAGALGGIIDWGDLCLVDPAVDLSIAFHFLPPSAHRGFRDAYGDIDERRWELARLRATCHAIAGVAYGVATGDEDMRREGLQTLEWIVVG